MPSKEDPNRKFVLSSINSVRTVIYEQGYLNLRLLQIINGGSAFVLATMLKSTNTYMLIGTVLGILSACIGVFVSSHAALIYSDQFLYIILNKIETENAENDIEEEYKRLQIKLKCRKLIALISFVFSFAIPLVFFVYLLLGRQQ